MVVLLAGRGFGTVDQVVLMDLVSFNTACECVGRLMRREKIENAQTQMIAAQGNDEKMKDWLKQWDPAPSKEIKDKQKAAEGNKAFMKAHSKTKSKK